MRFGSRHGERSYLRGGRKPVLGNPRANPADRGQGAPRLQAPANTHSSAASCAWRWKREGRRARIARPPQGMDFNDMLMDRAPRIKEGVQ